MPSTAIAARRMRKLVKGKAKNVQKIADGLIRTKGVKHGYLTLTTTGAGL